MFTVQPLVSIVVVTYNSAHTVLETLESIKEQKYGNIELIITDDSSTDETIIVCEKWLTVNRNLFVSSELLTTPVNTGVPANCNRGFKRANGDWIKCIAGDDLLFPNCIQQFIDNYKGNSNIVVGQCKKFYYTSEGVRVDSVSLEPSDFQIEKLNSTSVDKLFKNILFFGNCIFAPSVFIKRQLWLEVGQFDEKYRLIEDYPFWVKCLSQGFKIDFVNVPIAYYRYNWGSLTSSMNSFYNIDYWQCFQSYKKDVVYKQISKWNLLYWENELVLKMKFYVLTNIFSNKRTKASCLVDSVISYFSCYTYIPFISKILRLVRK